MKFVATLILTIAVAAGPAYAQDIGTDAQREAGKLIYDKLCAQCHGIDGDGNGPAKHYFRPQPRDLTSGMFKIRSTPSGELPTTDDLKKVIRDGMPYSGMPAWPSLSEDELTKVTYYIKTFNDGFADPDFVVPPIDLPRAPKYSDESAELGKAFYEENKCADCHGLFGRGDGKSSPTLKDEWEEPIRAADLTKRWTFRGGPTREDIYRTFSTGLNGSPMPSYADLIEPEDRWHLVDYVYSFSDRDQPSYSSLVVASAVEGQIDVAMGEALFESAVPAHFPVFGQVMEPGRKFFQTVTEVEVKAVFNATDVAILVAWNNLSGETTGFNSPILPVPMFDPNAADDPMQYSDAVAIQIPASNTAGAAKPYFLFGDSRNQMEIWFADLARSDGELMIGRGSQSIETVGVIPFNAQYDNGRWSVIYKKERQPENGFWFEEGAFSPISFSVWDGFNKERGNARGVTSWYYLYLEPTETESIAKRIAGFGLLTLLVEVVVIGFVRRRNSLNSDRSEA